MARSGSLPAETATADLARRMSPASPSHRQTSVFLQHWQDTPISEIAAGCNCPRAPSRFACTARGRGYVAASTSRPLTQPVENIFDQRHVQALSHPLRVRILAILDEREASPLELSRLLRAELGVISYHVRKLNALGFLRLERETRVRGAIQRHYSAVERPRVSDAAWARTPPVVKQALVQATIHQITSTPPPQPRPAGSTAPTHTPPGRR